MGAAPSYLPVNLVSASCGYYITSTALQVPGTGMEVGSACSLTTCNGGTFPGFQKWQYYIDYTLPARCSDWRFSYKLGNRSNVITTLVLPNHTYLYVEARLNNLNVPGNTSLEFKSDQPLFAVAYYQNCFGAGMKTWGCDDDSVSFDFIRPRNDVNDSIPFVSGYSLLNPISSNPPVHLDRLTGTVCMTPTAIEVGVIVVRASQWRKVGGVPVLVGQVMRDLQVYTYTSANHPPQLSGIDSTNNYSMTIPANKITCFNLFSSDSDATQITHLALSFPIPQISFIVDSGSNQSGRFCWQPLISDTGSCRHCFVVKVWDNACPAGQNSYTYCLTVVDSGYLVNIRNIEKEKNYVTIFPNPSSSHITISAPSFHHQSVPATASVLTVLGKVIQTEKINIQQNNNFYVDIKALASGIYFVRIEDESGEWMGKFVKE